MMFLIFSGLSFSFLSTPKSLGLLIYVRIASITFSGFPNPWVELLPLKINPSISNVHPPYSR